eukprot:Awhi_evm1s15755
MPDPTESNTVARTKSDCEDYRENNVYYSAFFSMNDISLHNNSHLNHYNPESIYSPETGISDILDSCFITRNNDSSEVLRSSNNGYQSQFRPSDSDLSNTTYYSMKGSEIQKQRVFPDTLQPPSYQHPSELENEEQLPTYELASDSSKRKRIIKKKTNSEVTELDEQVLIFISHHLPFCFHPSNVAKLHRRIPEAGMVLYYL